MHDMLYDKQKDLSEVRISSLANLLHLDKTQFAIDRRERAPADIKRDIDDGNRLGITGTPMFFLCGPRGEIWHIYTLAQIGDLIK